MCHRHRSHRRDPDLSSESWDDVDRRRRRTRRASRRSADRSPGDRSSRRHRAARRRATARMSVAIHGVVFASVLAALLVIVGFRVVFLVAACWGVGLAVHAFVCGAAPRLRRRWIETELGRTPRDEEMSESERLVRRMGDDPREPRSLDIARDTLDELARS